MLQHIKKVFIAEIIISCLTCFQRADYNLPLFTFAYFLWEYKSINVLLPLSSVSKASALLPLH